MHVCLPPESIHIKWPLEISFQFLYTHTDSCGLSNKLHHDCLYTKNTKTIKHTSFFLISFPFTSVPLELVSFSRTLPPSSLMSTQWWLDTSLELVIHKLQSSEKHYHYWCFNKSAFMLVSRGQTAFSFLFGGGNTTKQKRLARGDYICAWFKENNGITFGSSNNKLLPQDGYPFIFASFLSH